MRYDILQWPFVSEPLKPFWEWTPTYQNWWFGVNFQFYRLCHILRTTLKMFTVLGRKVEHSASEYWLLSHKLLNWWTQQTYFHIMESVSDALNSWSITINLWITISLQSSINVSKIQGILLTFESKFSQCTTFCKSSYSRVHSSIFEQKKQIWPFFFARITSISEIPHFCSVLK